MRVRNTFNTVIDVFGRPESTRNRAAFVIPEYVKDRSVMWRLLERKDMILGAEIVLISSPAKFSDLPHFVSLVSHSSEKRSRSMCGLGECVVISSPSSSSSD